MDFVKIEYDQRQPPFPPVRKPPTWATFPLYPAAWHAEAVQVVEGLVKAAGGEALVVLTLYSPLMWAVRLAGEEMLVAHLQENPNAVAKGLAIMTENVLNLVRGCKQVGVDGFYASTQGGEATRLPDPSFFTQVIKPTDLAVWDEIKSCPFNILHVCDYVAEYADLTPFLDYPGHVVNCSLKLGDRTLRPTEAAELFGRPFMGGWSGKV